MHIPVKGTREGEKMSLLYTHRPTTPSRSGPPHHSVKNAGGTSAVFIRRLAVVSVVSGGSVSQTVYALYGLAATLALILPL